MRQKVKDVAMTLVWVYVAGQTIFALVQLTDEVAEFIQEKNRKASTIVEED